MDFILKLIGRSQELFCTDIEKHNKDLEAIVTDSKFLVIGGAGSIGQAVVKEIFKRKPKVLHVVDISENNLVELVRDIRSSLGYIEGDFSTFVIDTGSDIFDNFIKNGNGYDYVFNLSALKHVRSEKDPYTLMRMIEVNILNTEKTLMLSAEKGVKKYFCVSTDKAANPVNMMGASKRIMEYFLMYKSSEIPVSTARFANVAFSDGSLLHGFKIRLEKEQPLSAPNDVRRYFITPKESGELCLLSALLGQNRDLFFPKLDPKQDMMTFSDIAIRFLQHYGYTPYLCQSEEEARAKVKELKPKGKWPVYFFKSDTTGEKDYEEFYTKDDILDLERFDAIGVIKNQPLYDEQKIIHFKNKIIAMRQKGIWTRQEIIDLFNEIIPEFNHKETGKFLDSRM